MVIITAQVYQGYLIVMRRHGDTDASTPSDADAEKRNNPVIHAHSLLCSRIARINSLLITIILRMTPVEIRIMAWAFHRA